MQERITEEQLRRIYGETITRCMALRRAGAAGSENWLKTSPRKSGSALRAIGAETERPTSDRLADDRFAHSDSQSSASARRHIAGRGVAGGSARRRRGQYRERLGRDRIVYLTARDITNGFYLDKAVVPRMNEAPKK
ncbi:MAG: hypothetical protein ABJF01_23805 [bacterium]